MPYGGGYSYLSFKFNKLNRYNFIKKSKKGAILIEFAFAVPVLFSLIYYVYDLAKIKQWNQRMDFATHCMANMFQNTSNITKKDVINILHAARLAHTPNGVKSFGNWNKTHTFTLFQLGILCVVGTDTNKCRVKWFFWADGENFSTYNKEISGSLSSSNSNAWNIFRSLTVGNEYSSNEVYPSLIINSDETKILLLHVFYCQFPNPDSWARGILGLHMALPIAHKYSDIEKTYLRSVVIYTPKPGTFDPNNPPQ